MTCLTHDAESEWQRLVGAVSRGDVGVLLSSEGASALRSAGGWVAVAFAGDEHDLARRRQEFVASFVTRREMPERVKVVEDKSVPPDAVVLVNRDGVRLTITGLAAEKGDER